VRATVSTFRVPSTSVTAVATEALSLDHLKVALASGPPVCTSTRYSRLSHPTYPLSGGTLQGSSEPGTATPAVLSRPAEGAVASFQPGTSPSAVAHVTPSAESASSLTCHTVCIRAAVSTPTPESISDGSSTAVTSRSQASTYTTCEPLGRSGGFGKYGCWW
jgi:hypothetical protein